VSQPFSNQPFPNQSGAPLSGGPVPGGYAEAPFGQPPPQKSSRWWVWILGGCGCSTLLLLLCCGGFTWWGVSKGNQVLADLVKTEVADNEDVKENLGEITSIKMNLMETGSEQKARGGAGNLIVFDAKGTEGDGKFIVETPSGGQGGGPFTAIELKLPDGTIKKIK